MNPSDSKNQHAIQRNGAHASQPQWFSWTLGALAALAVVLFIILYPPAKELAWETGRIVFTLFFTPFILEILCIIIGFAIVITLNNRRLAKEASDEWVYLHQVDPGEPATVEGIPEPLKRRIEDSPFVSKPATAGMSERVAEIGGYLDLGMVEEASAALFDVPESEVDLLPFLLLRIRLASLKGSGDQIATLTAAARAAGASEAEIMAAKNKLTD